MLELRSKRELLIMLVSKFRKKYISPKQAEENYLRIKTMQVYYPH